MRIEIDNVHSKMIRDAAKFVLGGVFMGISPIAVAYLTVCSMGFITNNLMKFGIGFIIVIAVSIALIMWTHNYICNDENEKTFGKILMNALWMLLAVTGAFLLAANLMNLVVFLSGSIWFGVGSVLAMVAGGFLGLGIYFDESEEYSKIKQEMRK